MRENMTRREWLTTTAAGSLGLMAAGRSARAAPRALGVQLYTVRGVIGKDTAATLKAIADIGYKEVEVIRSTLGIVAPAAREVGLAPVSVHVDTPLITGNWTPWREAAKQFPMDLPPEGYDLTAAMKELESVGAKYAVLSYLLPNERGSDAAFYERLAETLNKAGRQVKEAGLELCYHNHAFEFEPFQDGRMPLDVLMDAADPELVKLELDVFWVGIAGSEPVKLIEKFSGRIALMHLKDKAAGAATATQEMMVPPTAFKEVGSGSLDFPAILRAAEAAGVRHYFVEQDHTAGNPIDSLRKSYEYLSGL